MKKVYLCTVMLIFMVVQCYSQQHSISQDVLHIKKYDQAGKLVDQKTVEGPEVNKINLEKLVNEHQSDTRITISGHYTKGEIRSNVFFDSNTATTGSLCMNEQLVLRPTLGVGGCSNETFTGFEIKKVAEGSPASRIGLIAGDVIYSLDDKNITSYCDLQIAVRGIPVGAVVDVEFSKNGKVFIEEVEIIGKAYKNITFRECQISNHHDLLDQVDNESEITNDLTVYPNPTRELSYLKYDSESTDPVSYFVMDSEGKLIHQQHIENFYGSLRANYSFEGHTPGMYYFVVQQGGLSSKSKVLFIGN